MRAIVLFVFSVLVSTCAVSADTNLALVVGVGGYGGERIQQERAGLAVPKDLPNAIPDAGLVARALQANGFKVQEIRNPTKRELLAAISGFANRLRAAGPTAVGVFYFAGHGAQGRPALERDVDNYLIPVGADLSTEIDLESEALGLSRISAILKPGESGAVILILDACRNFALPSASRSGAVARGLAEARAAAGTLIAYSTSPGDVASDGPPGKNGPYARALGQQLALSRGKRLEDIFIDVRKSVMKETDGRQIPWENNSLIRPVMIGKPDQVVKGSVRVGHCKSLFYDVKKGTLDGLPPNLTREEVKREFPCYTGETEDGITANYGGGVFFNNHNFYFYTYLRYLEIRDGFKGKLSQPIFGKSRAELSRSFKFAKGWELPYWASPPDKSRPQARPHPELELIDYPWGCMLLKFPDAQLASVPWRINVFSVRCEDMRQPEL